VEGKENGNKTYTLSEAPPYPRPPRERRVVLLKTCTFCPPTKELHVKTKAGLNNLSLPYLCKKSHRLRKYDLKLTYLDLFGLKFFIFTKGSIILWGKHSRPFFNWPICKYSYTLFIAKRYHTELSLFSFYLQVDLQINLNLWLSQTFWINQTFKNDSFRENFYR
jgi:hypothetical protein